ncbi:MAG: ABC transporter permease subunit [Clostridia bacterium]|nr:ABC transporter permease subunit [Clostridia bacterium]
MLNPIMAFSATRRMRSFKTMLVVIAYVAALLLLALAFLGSFIPDAVYLNTMTRGPMCYLALLIAQFALIILIAPAMTSASIAGERERQTLDLLLVTNTGSFRIAIGKVMESFAVLALLIVCGLPVMSLCLLTGGVSLGQILIGELFLLAEAFACVSIGVFCSSVARSTVLSGVLSYLVIILVGVITALPFLFGYPQSITDVVYDRPLYAALTPGEARMMISPLLYMNPGFGLLSLVQGELHVLTSYTEYLGWGRILCTWRMADRAGWIFISLASAAGMLVIAAILIGLASLMIRKGHKTKSNA